MNKVPNPFNTFNINLTLSLSHGPGRAPSDVAATQHTGPGPGSPHQGPDRAGRAGSPTGDRPRPARPGPTGSPTGRGRAALGSPERLGWVARMGESDGCLG